MLTLSYLIWFSLLIYDPFHEADLLCTQDGTLTDSISAVEAAWEKVAQDIGEDPKFVITATHGKRAVDNLSHFKPHIKEHEMEDEVTKFEESILFFADAHRLHGPGSKLRNQPGAGLSTPIDQASIEVSSNDSSITTPSHTRGPFPPPSMKSSKFLSFGHRLLNLLKFSVRSGDILIQEPCNYGETIQDDGESDIDYIVKNTVEGLEAWQLEAASVDRAIQILPGVKKIIDSIPAGRYAVATSGTKIYGKFDLLHILSTPSNILLFFLSLRLHESCRHNPSACYYYRRRQTSQGRKAST